MTSAVMCPRCGSQARFDSQTGQPFCERCQLPIAGHPGMRHPHKKSNVGMILAIVFGSLAAVILLLAAIAIPAFMKYMKKAKTTEASLFVERMWRGAQRYYLDPPSAGFEAPVPGFPGPSAGPTPPLGTCCDQGGACAPDSALWEEEPWASLGFSLDDRHYYSYEYRVDPSTSTFTALAYGDLDCDGVYSTFMISGSADEMESGRPGIVRSVRESE